MTEGYRMRVHRAREILRQEIIKEKEERKKNESNWYYSASFVPKELKMSSKKKRFEKGHKKKNKYAFGSKKDKKWNTN